MIAVNLFSCEVLIIKFIAYILKMICKLNLFVFCFVFSLKIGNLCRICAGYLSHSFSVPTTDLMRPNQNSQMFIETVIQNLGFLIHAQDEFISWQRQLFFFLLKGKHSPLKKQNKKNPILVTWKAACLSVSESHSTFRRQHWQHTHSVLWLQLHPINQPGPHFL